MSSIFLIFIQIVKKKSALFFMLFFFLKASSQQVIIVDANGYGDFTNLQAAINSLSDSDVITRNILVKNGIYREKVFIEKHNIIIKGEDKFKTVLSQSISRDVFRCSNIDDWGVATINLKGNDITLENITVQNNYGFENTNSTTFSCLNDTLKKEKIINRDGHQMALRSFGTTRLKIINCILKSFGGDTVSPWNGEDGMFFLKDCIIEGGVDFYCPRGWAYAENCSFFSHSGSAAIWHDGSKNEDSKTVFVNCSFDGFEGFKLGRWHRDAQFYLLNCSFSNKMANVPIYLVQTSNTIAWGNRQYYYGCKRDGGNYNWFKNNINPELAASINANWVFKKRWNPLN